MKNNSEILTRCGRRLGCAAATLGLVVLSGFSNNAQSAVQKSPASTNWDCLITGGHQQGIALLTFSENDSGTGGTFSGNRLLIGKPTAGSSSLDARNVGGDVGRGTGTSSGTTSSHTNLFGFDTVSGPWQYDERGRVRGSFVEVIGGGQTTCTTNENISSIQEITTVPVTNPDGSVTFITTNITIFITNAPSIICSTNQGSSNAVSFVASVVPGKRLSLVASTVNGRIVYSGIAARTDLPDISGNWYALKTENHQEFLETFALMPSGVPNIYNVENGLGAGYDFGGVAMLSARKKIGFALESGSATNFAGIVTYGSLSRNTTNANTTGFDLGTAPAASIRYKAVRQ